MTYQSVDALQKTLADSVFNYATDRKKAAGRALGTLVELVTFYTLRAWELRDHIVIERSVPEFANPSILHNVEFSLHPIRRAHNVVVNPLRPPVTPAKLLRQLPAGLRDRPRKTSQLLTSDELLRNSCVVVEDDQGPVVANVDTVTSSECTVTVSELYADPFAIFECKRVGVEEGMKKGPQTIEKAKQGAYVARTVSALQKVRLRNGEVHGVLEKVDGSFYYGPYSELLSEVISCPDPAAMQGFVLTVGVVSNHGNWFTSEDHNKELRVLAQSYDWLLFLTDDGLAQFIEKLLLKPSPELAPARDAFLASYPKKQGGNRFTKVRIDLAADVALRQYFTNHEDEVEGWFNVIAPDGANLSRLRAELKELANKNWG